MPKKKIIKKPVKQKKEKVLPPKPVVAAVAPVPEKAKEPLQTPRGMRDILPAEAPLWQFVKEKAVALCHAFGYGRIETPILELKQLYVRGVGEVTDVVQKEMYVFKDQGGDELCLRPESTAAVARAYINHGMINLPQPVKLWHLGPMFRRDRPQAGRFRQFHQWSLEALGDVHPVLDAEVISIAMSFMKDCGLSVSLEINSIGCEQCRGAYKNELRRFYTPKRELLCETCKVRLEANVMRLLDCKESQCELLREGAPQLPDALCEPCREHFMHVLEYLEDGEISYTINPFIVRGLDYYNRTVFEIFPAAVAQADTKPDVKEDVSVGEEQKAEQPKEEIQPQEKGRQSALGGGGRYDGLIEQLGGRPTPGVGFSIGLERVIACLKAKGHVLNDPHAPRIFIAQLGEGARRKALTLWHSLRNEVPAAASLSKDGLKAQLEIANRLGVRFAVIIGQKEIIDHTAIIRDMEAGMQEVINYNRLVADIKKKLGYPIIPVVVPDASQEKGGAET